MNFPIDWGCFVVVAGIVAYCIFKFVKEKYNNYEQNYEAQWFEFAPPMSRPIPRPRSPPPQRRQPAAHDVIVFDTYDLKEEVGGGCAICLEEYEFGQTRATITACNHRYHAVCIKKWLMEKESCPLCRTHVV